MLSDVPSTYENRQTKSGIMLSCKADIIDYEIGISPIIPKLNDYQGAAFTSSYEFPGRYTCWDMAFINPPLVIISRQNSHEIKALNSRGVKIMAMLHPFMQHDDFIVDVQHNDRWNIHIKTKNAFFSEDQRSRQPSIFSLIRHILDLLKQPDEPFFGLYGAFAYDLVQQFESLTLHQQRDSNQRDLVLYLPDELYIVDHRRELAYRCQYELSFKGINTQGMAREGIKSPYEPTETANQEGDHRPSEYAATVEIAKKRFACGDLFEVVPSQTFYTTFHEQPSVLFNRMYQQNPSPYGFFVNLGEGEFIVGASPEMYVRVQNGRVETCPISGTIHRGQCPIEDAKNIQLLLESQKDEAELTMCTDVDRNDKSRVCKPGTVKVIGRRQIELYSRLIHTVDHVEGYLRDECDAIDAFLSHMWVVTVTGAPKRWAMQFIEEHEKTPRRWYGGAVGCLNVNGNMNTGLILRTVRLQHGVAQMRAGATLLYDSDPQAEEAETRLKASAFMDMLRGKQVNKTIDNPSEKIGRGKHILFIDHEDSFVHTLANYFEQTGAKITTIRAHMLSHFIDKDKYDLVVLSPGPGKPKDFIMTQNLDMILARNIPIFGVCLGLQGIVEYFGGTLAQLPYPMHGKPSSIDILEPNPLFLNIASPCIIGRYHSLYAEKETLPDSLAITATTEDGIIMAISHRKLPIHAVQFHPETIMSMANLVGYTIIVNIMELISAHEG